MSSPTPTATPPSAQEQLAACERAYEAGNFARVHELGRALLGNADPVLAARAAALLARVSVDPVSLGVLAVSLLFFVLIARTYVF